MFAVAGLAGCGSSGQTEPIRLAPPPTPSVVAPAPALTQDPWQDLSETTQVKEPPNTRYFDAAKAPACPEIEVRTAQGKEIALAPGQRGFVQPGYVTIVLFWNGEVRSARVAARHVNELIQTYAQWRVQAVSIVEKLGPKDASQAFAGQYGLTFPIYYEDNAAALQDMSGKVGANPKSVIPSIFIVDRQMRLRFFRGGFRFTVGGSVGVDGQPDEEKVMESAPPGRTVEDYLKTILSES
jgi:hypothetical protein